MAINFPSAPNTGDSHTDGSVTWIYNGSAWDSLYQPTAKAQVGLGNVDNTSDEDKPVSTAQQAALDALTKDDVGLDNVDNTSDINKPVSTAQQAAIDAAGGGSSFDQDLNTTDSPTFATLTTTNLDATGTVTADTVSTDNFQIASGVFGFKVGSVTVAEFTAGNAAVRGNFIPAYSNLYALGSSSRRWSNVLVVDVEATGTVKAGSSFQIATGSGSAGIENGTSRYEIAEGGSLYAYRDNSLVFVFGSGHNLSYADLKPSGAGKNLGDSSSRRWQTTHTVDLDATGTVKKGVYTVATLPTGEAGMTCFVSDANTTTRGSTAAGGGANFMPVYSDGTNWIIS